MTILNTHDLKAIADRLAFQAQGEKIRVTVHAHQEMVEESIQLDDVLCVLQRASVIENYPDHQRGPCCLVYGHGTDGNDIHVVCTTSHEFAIIITVYEPKLPKWESPFTRRKSL
jgi:hypothetical protein